MNRLAPVRRLRLAGIVIILLAVTSSGLCQDLQPVLPDGFLYAGRGAVEGTVRLVLASPTSAVLLSIVPDGTEVRRGDLVAAIDDNRLNASLTRQQTATKQAADTWKQAAEQLHVARELETLELEIAAREIRLARLNREQQLGESGGHQQLIGKATDNRQKAKTELDLLTTYLGALQDSSADLPTITEVKLKLLAVRSALRQVEMELDRLRGPARAHLEAELDLEVLRAQANQLKVTREQRNLLRAAESAALNRKNVLETLTNKLKEIEEQIAQCQMFAPHSGVVQHVEKRLAKGVTVRSGQALLAIVNTETLHITTLVDENQIRRVKTGQKATIHFEAVAQVYQGAVKEVSAALDGARLLNDMRQYAVTVVLKPPHDGIRLGMLAHVGIDISGQSE